MLRLLFPRHNALMWLDQALDSVASLTAFVRQQRSDLVCSGDRIVRER